MKVALVHDWLIHMRGGEKVLEAIAEVFPEATIYTLFAKPSRLSPSLQRMKIKTSVLQYFPGIQYCYRWLLPLLPFFIRSLRLEGVDLVISSSHCVAKGIKIPKGAHHVCYCHTPMRYLWGFQDEYFGRFPRWVLTVLTPLFNWLRKWDQATARGVHRFLCNSEHIRKKIQTIYGCDAEVIHPPVDLAAFSPVLYSQEQREDYYLVVSALAPYKRVDLVIQAFNDWPRNLIIVGSGPSESECRKQIRSGNIRMVGPVPQDALSRLYRGAKALIFPQEEDFGIVPLEAQASGTPVIALGRGGALETVVEGVFFYEQTVEAIRESIQRFESMTFDPESLRAHVLRFDKEHFKDRIRHTVENAIA